MASWASWPELRCAATAAAAAGGTGAGAAGLAADDEICLQWKAMSEEQKQPYMQQQEVNFLSQLSMQLHQQSRR